jgi:hypothetical protein
MANSMPLLKSHDINQLADAFLSGDCIPQELSDSGLAECTIILTEVFLFSAASLLMMIAP